MYVFGILKHGVSLENSRNLKIDKHLIEIYCNNFRNNTPKN